MNMFSNVIRGGPYKLFLELVMVLIGEDVVQDCCENEDNYCIDKIKEADPVALANLLEGYGADGHTLAHWCAKRGEYIV